MGKGRDRVLGRGQREPARASVVAAPPPTQVMWIMPSRGRLCAASERGSERGVLSSTNCDLRHFLGGFSSPTSGACAGWHCLFSQFHTSDSSPKQSLRSVTSTMLRQAEISDRRSH